MRDKSRGQIIMADALNVSRTGDNIYTFTKTVGGKKVVITVNDKDGDGFDYQDTISFKGDKTTFKSLKSSELFTALGKDIKGINYERSKLIDATNATAIPIVKKDDKQYINPKLDGTEYSFSSVYETIAPKQKSTSTSTTSGSTGASSGYDASSTVGNMGVGGGFSGIDSTSIGGSGATLNPMAALQLNNIGIGGSGMLAAFNMMGMNSMFAPLIAGMMPGFGVNIADSVNSMLINGLSKMDYKTDPDSITVTDSASFAKKWSRPIDLSKSIEETAEETSEEVAAKTETDEVGFGNPEEASDPAVTPESTTAAGAKTKATKVTPNFDGKGAKRTDYSDGRARIDFPNGSYQEIYTNSDGNRVCDSYKKDKTRTSRVIYPKGNEATRVQFTNYANTAAELQRRRNSVSGVEINRLTKELETAKAKCKNAKPEELVESTKKVETLQARIKNLKALQASEELKKLDKEYETAYKAYTSDMTTKNAEKVAEIKEKITKMETQLRTQETKEKASKTSFQTQTDINSTLDAYAKNNPYVRRR